MRTFIWTLVWLDNFLLEKFQKFSDFSQEFVGLTNFKLAYLLLPVVYFAILDMNFSMTELSGGNVFSSPTQVGLITFVFFVLLLLVHKAERQCSKNIEVKNELEAMLRGQRIIFTLILSPNLGALLLFTFLFGNNKVGLSVWFVAILGIVTFDCLLYFSSCTPKPPSRNKMGTFLRKLKRSLVPRRMVVQAVRG